MITSLSAGVARVSSSGASFSALRQARSYLESLGVSRDVVLTDGVRYRLYSAGQAFAPVAYANLARLKRSATAFFNLLRRP